MGDMSPLTDSQTLEDWLDFSDISKVPPPGQLTDAHFAKIKGARRVYVSCQVFRDRSDDPEDGLYDRLSSCGRYVKMKPELIAWAERRMLHMDWYVKLVIRDQDASLFLNYQQIIGSRRLADTPLEPELYQRLLDVVPPPSQVLEVPKDAKQVGDEVRAVLRDVTWHEAGCRLEGTLDRKLYHQVNRVLEACGGRWDKASRLHRFDPEGESRVWEAVHLGYYFPPIDLDKLFQYYPTPLHVVDLMVKQIGLQPCLLSDPLLCLEPSAGSGVVASRLRDMGHEVECYELEFLRAAALRRDGFKVQTCDFLERKPEMRYDVVMMNPPFTGGQDIRHVRHAYQFLKPGGRLVSVMSGGVMYRSDRRTVEFREWVEQLGGEYLELDQGAFRTSGTMASTVLVTVQRGK